jgi:hypothetical protein
MIQVDYGASAVKLCAVFCGWGFISIKRCPFCHPWHLEMASVWEDRDSGSGETIFSQLEILEIEH